jgi:hypothetical protein
MSPRARNRNNGTLVLWFVAVVLAWAVVIFNNLTTSGVFGQAFCDSVRHLLPDWYAQIPVVEGGYGELGTDRGAAGINPVGKTERGLRG